MCMIDVWPFTSSDDDAVGRCENHEFEETGRCGGVRWSHNPITEDGQYLMVERLEFVECVRCGHRTGTFHPYGKIQINDIDD